MLKHYPSGMKTGMQAKLAAEAFDHAAVTPATNVHLLGGNVVTVTGDAKAPAGAVFEFVRHVTEVLDRPVAQRFAA